MDAEVGQPAAASDPPGPVAPAPLEQSSNFEDEDEDVLEQQGAAAATSSNEADPAQLPTFADPGALSARKLRLLVCQTDCIDGCVATNLKRWGANLAAHSMADKVDVVHFGETAFSRYYYRDKEDAAPFMETAGEGPIFAFLSALAKRLHAYVAAGYGERTPDVNYNSLYVIGREGELIRSYRKRHLWQPDYTWAVPGSQDQKVTVQLCDADGVPFTAGLIICQEIVGDMHDKEAPTGPMRVREESGNGVDLVLYSTCWPAHADPATKADHAKTGGVDPDPAALERSGACGFWDKQMEAGLSEGRNVVFSASDCVGHEANVLAPESWGDDPLWVWLKNAETLYKRGSSGVQTLRARGGFEYAVPIGAPATETGTKYSMSNANEEWGLYEVEMARPEPETLA